MARRTRARPPAQLLAELRKRLSSGWPAGLTVLTGDDLYHLDLAQQALLDSLAPSGSSEFALTVFGDRKIDVTSVVAAARSVGMFDASRVVLVRDLELLDGEPDAIEEYAARPPERSFLLVRAPSLDQRRKLHKALAQGGVTLLFESAAEGDIGRLSTDVRQIAKDKGVELDRDAVTFLAESCAGDLHRVSSELDKLISWTEGAASPRVGLAVVREVVAAGGLLSGFELADAVLARDRARSLALARELVDSGDEPIRILGALAYRARGMLQAKALLESGATSQQVITAGRAWSQRDQFLAGLARYRLTELLEFPSRLLEADRTLKSRAIDPRAVLEELVGVMTASPTDREEVRHES